MEDALAYFNLCTACHNCYITCPIYIVKQSQSFSPRTRIFVAGLLAQGRLNPKSSKKLIETIFSCVLCDMCHNVCPSGVDVPKIVKIVRNYLVEQNVNPKPVSSIIETIKHSKNIFNLDNDDRLNWSDEIEDLVKDKINKSSEIAFYIGCQESFKGSLFMIPISLVKLLDKAGVDFTLLAGEEWCCTNPALLVGDRSDPIKDFVKHNVDKMESLGVKKIIMTCPGCYRAWTVAYPQILGVKKLSFEIIHSTELIANLLKEGKIKLTKSFPKKIGYQDPCELGRISGIFNAPREIIAAIPDAEFIELDANKMEATCCGGGGLCKASYDPIATEIASRKVDEFIKNGIEVLTTACPACYDNLATAIQDKKGIELIDLHELVIDLMD
ncbi:MAG: (Fe-S)-binding protein [Candidatus Helarchaeota archaeon]